MKPQIFTLDFVTGQLRLAMVAILAYGGGRGWFTPTDATFITAIAGALGPLLIPWIWSIVVNNGKISVSTGSAAAAVAEVEKTDPATASAAAQAAKVGAIMLAIALASVFAFSGDASAQIKLKPLTGNVATDFNIGGGASGTSKLTGNAVIDITAALDAKLLPDLQYALKLATAAKNEVTGPCFQAWIDIINTRLNAVKNADGTPIDLPDPHLITDFEKLVEMRNALQPESQFMLKCSPVASMVKLDIAKFMGLVISGGAGLAAMVPGL